MLAELGLFAASLALFASVASGALGLAAGARDEVRLSAPARASAQIAFIACLVAMIALVTLFVQLDFTVALVANHAHTAQPVFYRVSAAWGNHEGSMLLWCLVSAASAAALAQWRGAMPHALWARAVGVQGLVTAGALVYALAFSNPFARLDPAPFEGRSLNPLLQDPALAAHPPLLYAGYVGLSVPFSLAIAALLQGETSQVWARALRPWTLLAWTFLTGGVALGSYWAYYELGWGGWWFWDPVENASLMPWLVACALVHSAIVTERRGSLASWTILLAITGFGFALLGTFLVRSGVLTSVHAFAVDPRRGVAVLALLILTLGVGLGLYAWRAPRLQRASGFMAASREGFLLWNNIGMSVVAGVILVGTLYPLVVEALSGRLLSVGAPFFNLTASPMLALILLALPIAPLLAWRSGDLKTALLALAPAALAAAAAAAYGLARGQVFAAFGLFVGVWVIAGGIVYLATRLSRGEGAWTKKWRALPLSVWALALAHFGAGFVTLGATAAAAFRTESSATLASGQSTYFAGERITLERVVETEGPNYYATRAILRVGDGAGAYRLTPERRFYPGAGQPTTEVAIRTFWAGDLYIAMGEPQQGRAAHGFRFYTNPLVTLLFLGTFFMALGGVAALAALARKRVV